MRWFVVNQRIFLYLTVRSYSFRIKEDCIKLSETSNNRYITLIYLRFAEGDFLEALCLRVTERGTDFFLCVFDLTA